jgi:hypothetical protein
MTRQGRVEGRVRDGWSSLFHTENLALDLPQGRVDDLFVSETYTRVNRIYIQPGPSNTTYPSLIVGNAMKLLAKVRATTRPFFGPGVDPE